MLFSNPVALKLKRNLKQRIPRWIYDPEFPLESPVFKATLLARGRRPTHPNPARVEYYRQYSSWDLDQQVCPCDVHFAEYLQNMGVSGKRIFHFGTGNHHTVGRQNQIFPEPNEILAITASAPEHQIYVQLVLQNPALMKFYKVLFGDIYTLTAGLLPEFDVVTLFHLCEFYLPENAALLHQNDTSLLQLFLDQLHPEGRILFYPGSLNWHQAEPIVHAFEAAGKLQKSGEFKSLLIYSKGQ